MARQIVGPDRFLEVYLDAPLRVCVARDVLATGSQTAAVCVERLLAEVLRWTSQAA